MGWNHQLVQDLLQDSNLQWSTAKSSPVCSWCWSLCHDPSESSVTSLAGLGLHRQRWDIGRCHNEAAGTCQRDMEGIRWELLRHSAAGLPESITDIIDTMCFMSFLGISCIFHAVFWECKVLQIDVFRYPVWFRVGFFLCFFQRLFEAKTDQVRCGRCGAVWEKLHSSHD